ncbi:unnamed protein product [Auanema sp. JU1783]|nr:unnamed protein product [Auanema sp. JU1783]
MMNIRKRLGLLESHLSDENLAVEAAPGSSAESWVELAPSRNSLCSSIEATALDEKLERDSRLSPVSLHSPVVEFDSLEQVKYKLIQDMLPPGKHTDWMWDWSSHPEVLPPKSQRNRQYDSNLTTPPNSPEPDFFCAITNKKHGYISSFQFAVGIIVSNIVTFVVGATVGFIVCKRLTRNRNL